MNKLFQYDNLFVILAIVMAVAGLAIFSAIEKGDESLWFNVNNNQFADFIFKVLTRMGEIFFIIPVVVFVWFKKGKENAVVMISTLLCTGVVVQALKRLVFDHMHRPAEVIGKIHELRIIDGVQPVHHYAFPSGHTAAAFAMMFTLAVIYKSRAATFFFFLLAMLIGISRMYLLQHFLIDVIGGALVGVSIAWIVNRYFTLLFKKRNANPLPQL